MIVRTTIRRILILSVLLAALGLSGCSALIGAGIREAFDHGSRPRYAKKGYWGHVRDISRERRCGCRHSCHHH